LPQIQFSANPLGTILGKENSYFKLYPIGNTSITSIGNWQ